MSKENVEAMRRGIERFNRAEEDDALLEDFYDADAVYYSRADEPDTGVYRGREAIRGLMRMWRDTFAQFSFDVDERRSISTEDGARILLLLAPWPGAGHYHPKEPA